MDGELYCSPGKRCYLAWVQRNVASSLFPQLRCVTVPERQAAELSGTLECRASLVFEKSEMDWEKILENLFCLGFRGRPAAASASDWGRCGTQSLITQSFFPPDKCMRWGGTVSTMRIIQSSCFLSTLHPLHANTKARHKWPSFGIAARYTPHQA